MPYLKYVSGGSTLNGTPGGDRRVLGGQTGGLSLPPHRVDADCSGSAKFKMNPAAPKKYHEATAAQRP